MDCTLVVGNIQVRKAVGMLEHKVLDKQEHMVLDMQGRMELGMLVGMLVEDSMVLRLERKVLLVVVRR